MMGNGPSEPISSWAAVDARARTANSGGFAETEARPRAAAREDCVTAASRSWTLFGEAATARVVELRARLQKSTAHNQQSQRERVRYLSWPNGPCEHDMRAA